MSHDCSDLKNYNFNHKDFKEESDSQIDEDDESDEDDEESD